MPQVVAVAAASFFTGAAVTGFGAAIGTASAAVIGAYAGGYLVGAAALSYGFSSISRAVSPKPRIPSLQAQGLQVNVRDPAAPRQIIYGRRRVGGILYPVGTSGTNNEYLHLIVMLAGHECDELGDITFGDEVVPLDGSGNATGRFAGFARVLKHTGAYDQTVDTSLQTDLSAGYWSNNHRLQGIAYLYVRLKVSADLFPGGVPEIYCLVKGRKVYDHREGAHDPADASTWTWSANAALCLADWVRGVPFRDSSGAIVRVHGVGALDAEINYTDVDAAANICDENVTLDDLSTEDRYTCNGVILTSVRPADGIELLKSAMAGECIYVGGKWVILAGAYRAATLAAFDEDDLRAPLSSVRLKPATGDLYNVGRGLYVSSGNNWQPTDLPQVRNSTYITQDGGDELPLDMEFPFTTSHATGQRLLKIAIERSRQGIAFVARCKLGAWQARPGDVIQWTDAELGWSAKNFEVLGVSLVVESDANGHPYIGADLTLRETASGVWTWANGEETAVDAAPNTTLRSPFDIANPTSLSVANSVQQQAEGTAIPRLQVSWTAPADANVTTRGSIRLEYKLAAASDWLPVELLRGDITTAFILAVVIGQSYNVRVRSETDLHVSQSWVTSGSITVTGDTTAPAAPSGLAAAVGTGKAVSLDWSDNTEDDLSEYGVYRDAGAGYVKIAEVRASRFVDVEVTLGAAYSYKVTAFDTSENESGFSSIVSATPITITDGSIDQTVPSTPSAPTYVSEAVYQGGDGTVFCRITIACPALPSGAKLNQVLYRINGSTAWTIADELFASGNKTLDDLSPGQAYEFAIRSISFSNVPSAVSATLSRTAPNKTTGPNAPTGITYTSGSAAGYGRAPSMFSGVVQRSMRVNWTHSTSRDLAYYEYVDTATDTEAAANAATKNIIYESEKIFAASIWATSYFRIRAIDTTGNASAWAGGGTNMDAVADYAAGTMTNQNATAVNIDGGTVDAVTLTSDALNTGGIKTGSTSASSVRKVRARYTTTEVITLAGGAASEDESIDLTNRGFATKPDMGQVEVNASTVSDELEVACFYNFDNGSNSSTSAWIKFFRYDGGLIVAGQYRVSVTFEEYD